MIHHLALQNVMHFVESLPKYDIECACFRLWNDVKEPLLRVHARRRKPLEILQNLTSIGVAALKGFHRQRQRA